MNARCEPVADVVHQTDGWRIRLATPADNEQLCRLFRNVETNGELNLSEERDPDFFALHALHLAKPYTMVLEDTSDSSGQHSLVGCCSAIVRDGWIQGKVVRIGYVCDLRFVSEWRKAKVFPLALRVFIQYLHEREGVEVMFGASLRDNLRAKGARLLAKGRHLTPYQMVSVQFVGKVSQPKHAVRQASQADIAEIQAFLAAQSQRRTFGVVYQDNTLTQRLERWPGLRIEDFLLIRDAQHQIVACAAPYDTEQHTRRSRVKGYSGRMVPLRKLYNIEAFLRGFLPLPDVGECFHYASLTHFEVKDEDPELAQSLLRGVYRTLHGKPLHFLSAFVPEASALNQAYKGLRTQKIPMDLFYFPVSGTAWERIDLKTHLPGFEMALH